MCRAICGEHLVHLSLLLRGRLLRAVLGATWTHDVVEEAQRIVIHRAVVEADVVVMRAHRDVLSRELGITAADDSDYVTRRIWYRLDGKLEVELAWSASESCAGRGATLDQFTGSSVRYEEGGRRRLGRLVARIVDEGLRPGEER